MNPSNLLLKALNLTNQRPEPLESYIRIFDSFDSSFIRKIREIQLQLPALVEEERVPGYRPEFYYPANPGEVLNNRYKILTKIKWGTASTVWLAEDLER
jgi:hypothetical protein